MTEDARQAEIHSYWEKRAAAYSGAPGATTDDVWMRELEVATFRKTLVSANLPPGAAVLDVGCGDGYSTLKLAEAAPGLRFVGVDYSENMLGTARSRLANLPQLSERVEFFWADATDLSRTCGNVLYAAILTDRCLINLPSLESQSRAIAGIAEHLSPGGVYIGIENFLEGQENLTSARGALGLPPIPVRWHNRFFTEAEFTQVSEPYFTDHRFEDFASSYYLATRVLYSAMCRKRGEEPDYQHDIHQLSVHLPPAGCFSPVRLVRMRRR